MTRQRSFPWEEARTRWQQGETMAALATEYGVSVQGIRLACHPIEYAASLNRSAEYQRSGTCVDCGKQCSRNDSQLRTGISKGRCRDCAHKAAATSARDTELLCFGCREWKPDNAFPLNITEHGKQRRRNGPVFGLLPVKGQEHRGSYVISDHDLTVAAQTGDHRAADQLVRRHTGLAYTIAGDFYLPGADHDDTRQEALIGLYVAIVSYREGHGSTFPQFAAYVIRRRLYTAVKLATRQKHRPLTTATRVAVSDDGHEIAATDLIEAPGSDPATVAEHLEDLRQLAVGIRDLSPLERRSLLGIATGHTYHEISNGNGDTAKSIDNAAQRARVKLRALLEAA